MADDCPHGPIRWSWIVWGSIVVGLVAIAWVQFRVNRDLQAERVAWATAANHQLALNQATAAAIRHYKETHNFGDSRKPTLEQFCKDMNAGRPIGERGIFRDPITGGEVQVFSFQDGHLGEMANVDDLPPHVTVRFATGMNQLRGGLEVVFFLSWVAAFVLVPRFYLDGTRRKRIAFGQWLVCLSMSQAFLRFVDSPAVVSMRWGVGFLTLNLIYLAWVIVGGREIDPTPRCAKCRYDLTGNESGICPECGTAVKREVVV